jgi:hypothetical protein
MSVQGISDLSLYSSSVLGTQKQTDTSDTQSLTVLKRDSASQDTYIPGDTTETESAGIYSLVSDGEGGQTISFDAPAQGGGAPAQGAGGASGGTSSTSDSTDDLEDEIEELEEEKEDLQEQLNKTEDEAESKKLEQQIKQLDTQIQMKQSELYESESESES